MLSLLGGSLAKWGNGETIPDIERCKQLADLYQVSLDDLTNYSEKKAGYPWFMVWLFAIAGIFIVGWTGGWVTNKYTDMFAGNGELILGFVKYLVYCMCGIGPLWFMHELMLATVVLLLIRKMDKKDKILTLGGRA